jgi:hypothetical protein
MSRAEGPRPLRFLGTDGLGKTPGPAETGTARIHGFSKPFRDGVACGPIWVIGRRPPSTPNVLVMPVPALRIPSTRGCETSAPKRVVQARSSDQVAYRFADPRSATERTGFPSPVGGETHSMPTHDRVGPDNDYGVKDARVATIEPDEHGSGGPTQNALDVVSAAAGR